MVHRRETLIVRTASNKSYWASARELSHPEEGLSARLHVRVFVKTIKTRRDLKMEN